MTYVQAILRSFIMSFIRNNNISAETLTTYTYTHTFLLLLLDPRFFKVTNSLYVRRGTFCEHIPSVRPIPDYFYSDFSTGG